MRYSAAAIVAGASLAAAQVPAWGQCGGIGFSGSTTCVSGYTCKYSNPYYSQCLPGTASATPTTTARTTSTTSTSTSAASTPTSTGTPSTGSGLDAKIKAKGKLYFGTAVDQNTLSVSQIDSIVKAEFGVVTPENSMKWDSTESTQGSFTLTGADYLVNYATTNGKKVRGHTLVWHSQLPGWVSNINSAATLTSVIQNHVTTIMTRYKGKILHWDVVNEVFEDSGVMRNSVFYRLLGEQFLDIAFKAARAADPAAKLCLNDYNLDYASDKLTNFVALVNRLIARGVPIDCVGTQAHLIVGNGAIPYSSTYISQLAGTGLDVAITELDIRMTLPSDATKVAQQSTDYTNVVKACLGNTKCVGITVWGVDDGHSWVPSTFSGQGDALLWNSSYQKKAAYTAVSNALN